MQNLPRLILASASPRRRALLAGLGLATEVMPADVDETAHPGETPEQSVVRLARLKGLAVADDLRRQRAVVLAADTVVALGPRGLGKPRSGEHAREMLTELSGREHRVVTGIFVGWTDDPRRRVCRHQTTRVVFRTLDPAWIDWYVESGEPLDKAGAYGIQDRAALLVQSIEGSWSNVVGLPLEALPDLFEEIGVDLLTLLTA